MAIFNNPLTVLMKHRLTWLNARSGVLTENIARADIKGAFRKEIKSFQKIVAESRKKTLSANSLSDSTNKFDIDANDIKQTGKEIERETEVLEMSHNAMEQEALITLIKDLHSLYKLVISRQT